jgi:hypothetical protein
MAFLEWQVSAALEPKEGEDWFYVMTLQLPSASQVLNASYSGLVTVLPSATPSEIFNSVKKMIVDEVLSQSGRNLERSNVIFYHAEPNRPVGQNPT